MSSAKPATLTASPSLLLLPAFTSHPQNVTLGVGQSHTFTVSATTVPADSGETLSFGWQMKLAGTSYWFNVGGNSTTHTITNAQPSQDGAQYRARVRTVSGNNYGAWVYSEAATLTVLSSPPAPPSIVGQPSSIAAEAGSSAQFQVLANGTAPLAYQWTKDGAPIAGATGPSLLLSAAQSSNAGAYAVAVSNAYGTVTSSTAVLSVFQVPPSITVQPAGGGFTSGQDHSLTVAASGTSPLSFQWWKGATTIPGATGSQHVLTNMQVADSGNYTVVISNAAGQATSTAAVVTVTPAGTPPSISDEPDDVLVSAGQAATFTVAAGGSTPLSYQWYVNGGYSSQDTHPTFTIPAVQPPASGSKIRVVISNAAGQVTSREALLSVTTDPVSVAMTPSNASMGVGQSQAFTATVSRTQNTAVSWSIQEGTSGGTVSEAGIYTAPTVAGTYHLVASSQADPARSAVVPIKVIPVPCP